MSIRDDFADVRAMLPNDRLSEGFVHDAHVALGRIEDHLEAAAWLIRYPASADGVDEFVEKCRAWLDAYGPVSNQDFRPEGSE